MFVKIFLLCVFMCAPGLAIAQKKAKKHTAIRQVDPDTGLPNPFVGKPFKGGDTVTQQIVINVGAIPIRGKIKFEIYDDADGMIYQWRHTYRINVISLKIDRAKTKGVPAEIIDQLESVDHVELKDKDLLKKVFPHESDEYLLCIRDFNMDGKPDFAFVYDQGFHSNFVLYDIWVNMNGRLVKWNSLSGYCVEEQATADRTLRTVIFDTAGPVMNYYKIAKDTTLVSIPPIPFKE